MDGNFKRLIVDRPDRESSHRRYAAVAGVLCAGASLCTLASSILLEATAAMTAIGLASFGLLLAFLCFVVPWERVAGHFVHLAPAAATLAVAIATTTIDPTYGFYLVLVAGFVAYSFRDRRVLGLHLAAIALALAAPVAIEPEGTRKAVACALIFGPGVLLVAVLAAYLRRTTDARDRAYREFAADAMALAARIRSRVGGPAGGLPPGEWLEQPAPAVPLRNVGVAKIVRSEPSGPSAAARQASSLQERLPMTAVAIAASIVAVVSTTAALLRDGGERQAATGATPALVRDAAIRTAAEAPSAGARHSGRRDRSERSAAPAESPVGAPAAPVPATAAGPGEASGGGAGERPQPSAPASTANAEIPVPVRPQAAQPAAEPPPVQQGAAAGPVETALNVAQETVGPVVSGLGK